MAEIKIAGVMRAGAFSPNHIGNDAAIFNIVAEQLRKRGCIVNIYNEEQFIAGASDERIIINMCRENRSIERLQQLEDNGALVINSGYGIENCIRERMARILLGSGLPYPESLTVNTDEAIRDRLNAAKVGSCWIKRADTHSMHKEDVTYVRHPEEAQEILQEYFLRGIKRAVINRHLKGHLVKFYGIAGTQFFHWFFPRNPEDVSPAFDPRQLRAIAERAADVLDVKIYGGDCIVDTEGNSTIVDFKDWPSFAPCRAEAAPQIARFIINAIKKHHAR